MYVCTGVSAWCCLVLYFPAFHWPMFSNDVTVPSVCCYRGQVLKLCLTHFNGYIYTIRMHVILSQFLFFSNIQTDLEKKKLDQKMHI